MSGSWSGAVSAENWPGVILGTCGIWPRIAPLGVSNATLPHLNPLEGRGILPPGGALY